MGGDQNSPTVSRAGRKRRLNIEITSGRYSRCKIRKKKHGKSEMVVNLSRLSRINVVEYVNISLNRITIFRVIFFYQILSKYHHVFDRILEYTYPISTIETTERQMY